MTEIHVFGLNAVSSIDDYLLKETELSFILAVCSGTKPQ